MKAGLPAWSWKRSWGVLVVKEGLGTWPPVDFWREVGEVGGLDAMIDGRDGGDGILGKMKREPNLPDANNQVLGQPDRYF